MIIPALMSAMPIAFIPNASFADTPSRLRPGNTTSDWRQAESTLRIFMDYVHASQFDSAAEIYAGDYSLARHWSVNRETEPSRMLEIMIRGGVTGLPIRRVYSKKFVSPDTFLFIVSFANDDGSLFHWGPFEGEPGPAETRFSMTVIRVSGRYYVSSLPPITP